MNEPKRSPFMLLVCGLLAANLGLLWLQGAQLNRQHDTLRQIHMDIEDLTDAIDSYANGDGGDNGDNGQDGAVWAPAARHHRHARRGLARASFQDPAAAPQQPAGDQDMMDQGRKEQEDANKSARDAVAKARDDQQKLSISENYRKGQEERQIQEAQYAWTRWIWLGLGVLVLVFLGRAWVAKRSQ